MLSFTRWRGEWWRVRRGDRSLQAVLLQTLLMEIPHRPSRLEFGYRTTGPRAPLPPQRESGNGQLLNFECDVSSKDGAFRLMVSPLRTDAIIQQNDPRDLSRVAPCRSPLSCFCLGFLASFTVSPWRYCCCTIPILSLMSSFLLFPMSLFSFFRGSLTVFLQEQFYWRTKKMISVAVCEKNLHRHCHSLYFLFITETYKSTLLESTFLSFIPNLS